MFPCGRHGPIGDSVFFSLVFMEIIGEKSRFALQDHLHLITAPLQVIWGKQDQVTAAVGRFTDVT